MKNTSVVSFRYTFMFILLFVCANIAFAHEGADHGGVATAFESEVEIHVIDNFQGPSQTKYFVKDRNGKRKELEFPAGMKLPTQLTSGQRIQVRGHIHANKPDHVLLDQEVAAIGVISTDSGSTTTITSTGATVSVRNLIAIVADFNNMSVSCTEDTVRNILFAPPPAYSVANYYIETSKGKMTFAGEVVRVKVPLDIGTTCDYNTWMSAARTEAAKVMSLSGYSHSMLVMPAQAPCGFAGLGTLGWGSTWIKTCSTGSVYAHELGHNLNMHHAGTPGYEYGDGSDVMGGGYAPVNSLHSIQKGWTPAANVVDVRASGTYRLTSLETDPAAATSPQVLKVLKNDTGDFYYLSLREPVGLFGSRFIGSSYANRLNVHRWAGSITNILGTRGINEVYSDTLNNIAITPVAINGNQLDVQITVNDVCTRKAPTITLYNPSAILPGATTSISVYVQNNDSYYCSDSTFNLGLTGGTADVSFALTQSSVTLKPGAAGYYTINVTTTSTAPLGSYAGTTTAVDSADGARTATAPFTVTLGTQRKGKGNGRNR